VPYRFCYPHFFPPYYGNARHLTWLFESSVIPQGSPSLCRYCKRWNLRVLPFALLSKSQRILRDLLFGRDPTRGSLPCTPYRGTRYTKVLAVELLLQ
jgi:hypothetical protein